MKIKKVLLTVLIAAVFTGCGSSGVDDTADTKSSVVLQKTVLNADISDENSLEVYWSAQEGVKYYILEYGAKDSGFTDSITLNDNVTRYKIDNLQNGEVYIFRLTEVFENGEKKTSDVFEAKTGTSEEITNSDSGPAV